MPYVIYTNGSYASSTVGAPSGTGGSCGMFRPGSGLVVYQFTASRSSSVTVDLCNAMTTFDTVLWIGTICGTSNVGCNDDMLMSACNRQSTLTFAATAGITYYLVVSGYNGAAGPFQVNISGL
jgi:hypothetical protein